MSDIDPSDITPPGVTLRDPADFDSLRQSIFDHAHKAMAESFPVRYGGVRIELHDHHYDGPEHFSLAEQKKAILEDRDLTRKMRGTLRLVDEATGDTLDEQKLSLLRVPYLTERGTWINGGSEYTTANQARLLPGVYTRRQENGGLETQFNSRPGTGPAFRVGLEPDTAQYRLNVRGSNLHLYSLFKDIGVPDEQLIKEWGPEIFKLNADKYDARVLNKAFAKLVPTRDQKPDATHEQKAELIKAVLDRVQVHEGVARRHLPNMFDTTKSAEWQARWEGVEAAEKLLEAEIGKVEFAPDRGPDDAFIKLAAQSEQFEPTLEPDELKGEFANLYGKVGPRLAGMKKWPKEWFPPGSDAQGWVSWYRAYGHGKRTEDDQRQISRWKRFHAREVPKFKAKPSARAAFALRQWAIDPMKLLPEDKQEDLKEDMEAYRDKAMADHLRKTASFDPDDLPEVGWHLQGMGEEVGDILAPHLDERVMECLSAGLGKQADTASDLASLIGAKRHSDLGQYNAKAAIMQALLHSSPEAFIVDSRQGPYWGITHKATGFQMHVPRTLVPAAVEVQEHGAPRPVEGAVKEAKAVTNWGQVERNRLAARKATEEPKSVQQASADNSKNGKFWWNGLQLSIETAKGQERKGVSPGGKAWSNTMTADYGRILGTVSDADGDHVDVFIGPDLDAPVVWVVDQHNADGSFDEAKCMLGVGSEEEARELYNSNYAKGWKGCKAITPLTVPQFKEWARNGDTGKPLANQKSSTLP